MRAVDGGLPAGHTQWRRRSADLSTAEAVPQRSREPGPERRRGVESGSRRAAREGPWRRNLPRQLQRELLRRGLISFRRPPATARPQPDTGAAAFPAGSLGLQTPLPRSRRRRRSRSRFRCQGSRSTTASRRSARHQNAVNPNWTAGYQRRLSRSAAIEVRYVGNHGYSLWRAYT